MSSFLLPFGSFITPWSMWARHGRCMEPCSLHHLKYMCIFLPPISTNSSNLTKLRYSFGTFKAVAVMFFDCAVSASCAQHSVYVSNMHATSTCLILHAFLGWESQLLETGFLAMFLCPVLNLRQFPRQTPTSLVVVWGYRWLIFRIMIGAVSALLCFLSS